MSDYDHLTALIDDAVGWADQFCESVALAGGFVPVHPESPIEARVAAYRAALLLRFADLAHGAAQSAGRGRPVTTSSLVRSAFETFTRLFELRDHLEAAFGSNNLDGLDGLIRLRLFGPGGWAGRGGAEAAEEDEFGLDLACNPDDAPQVPLPIPDNDGDGDNDLERIDPGARVDDRHADLALKRLMRTLIAIEMSFDNCYRALDLPIGRLETMFSPGMPAGRWTARQEKG